jgi:hypothetical protein
MNTVRKNMKTSRRLPLYGRHLVLSAVVKNVENIAGGNQAQYYYAKDVSTVYGTGNLDIGLLF